MINNTTYFMIVSNALSIKKWTIIVAKNRKKGTNIEDEEQDKKNVTIVQKHTIWNYSHFYHQVQSEIEWNRHIYT